VQNVIHAEIVAIKYYDYFTQKCIKYMDRLYQNIEILINNSWEAN